jgi:hypothetical protein
MTWRPFGAAFLWGGIPFNRAVRLAYYEALPQTRREVRLIPQ